MTEKQDREDHRKVVAARRREKMRRRLIDASVIAFARKEQKLMIDDIITEAQVSRGSFYQHFSSVEDALMAAKAALGRELVATVVAADIPGPEDPAAGFALNLLRIIKTFHAYPLLARFMILIQGRATEIDGQLVAGSPHFLEQGFESGRFTGMPKPLAVDLIHAGTVSMLRREIRGQSGEGDREEFVAAIMRMLGLDEWEAGAMASQPCKVTVMPPESLIARCEAARVKAEEDARAEAHNGSRKEPPEQGWTGEQAPGSDLQ